MRVNTRRPQQVRQWNATTDMHTLHCTHLGLRTAVLLVRDPCVDVVGPHLPHLVSYESQGLGCVMSHHVMSRYHIRSRYVIFVSSDSLPQYIISIIFSRAADSLHRGMLPLYCRLSKRHDSAKHRDVIQTARMCSMSHLILGVNTQIVRLLERSREQIHDLRLCAH